MTIKNASQFDETTRPNLSKDDQNEYSRLLRKLTPSSSTYRKYRQQVGDYMYFVGWALPGKGHLPLRMARLRRSTLFNGLEYLVAYVDDGWLNRVAPGCDAISSAMMGPRSEEDEWMNFPPLVFLPETKRRARNNTFRSIVEHEIVHINQAILGTFPTLPAKPRAEDLLDQMSREMTAEYEACFLQTARWPTQYHIEYNLSLGHWCLLRGYTQALEHHLLTLAEMDFSPNEAERFLEKISTSLAEMLRRIGATEDIAIWFLSRFNDHLLIAMDQVITVHPKVKEHPAFIAAVYWLHHRREKHPRS